MNTKCTPKQLELQDLGKRKIVISNDADVSTSNGGFILLNQIERKFGLCQGYEDLNDHDKWRNDSLLSFVCGKENGTHFWVRVP